MPRMGTPGGTASPAPAPAGPAAPGAGASGAGLNLSDIQKQIAEAKRKIAAGLEQKKVQDNPYLVSRSVCSYSRTLCGKGARRMMD